MFFWLISRQCFNPKNLTKTKGFLRFLGLKHWREMSQKNMYKWKYHFKYDFEPVLNISKFFKKKPRSFSGDIEMDH